MLVQVYVILTSKENSFADENENYHNNNKNDDMLQ